MGDQELRTSSGVLIGKIKEVSNGKLEIRNASGVHKGTYDPKTNETRNSSGVVVGKGNLLSSLL